MQPLAPKAGTVRGLVLRWQRVSDPGYHLIRQTKSDQSGMASRCVIELLLRYFGETVPEGVNDQLEPVRNFKL